MQRVFSLSTANFELKDANQLSQDPVTCFCVLRTVLRISSNSRSSHNIAFCLDGQSNSTGQLWCMFALFPYPNLLIFFVFHTIYLTLIICWVFHSFIFHRGSTSERLKCNCWRSRRYVCQTHQVITQCKSWWFNRNLISLIEIWDRY